MLFVTSHIWTVVSIIALSVACNYYLQFHMSTKQSDAMIHLLHQLLSFLLLLGTGVMESKLLIKWFPYIQETVAQWYGMKGKQNIYCCFDQCKHTDPWICGSVLACNEVKKGNDAQWLFAELKTTEVVMKRFTD